MPCSFTSVAVHSPVIAAYSPAANTVDLGLGNGWSNSFGVSALRTSDPYAGLGGGSATNVAAAVAALYVAEESYTYDADGNIKTRVTRRGDTISFGYDTLNRLTGRTEPAGTPSVTYGYDLVGRLISVSDNGPALVAATPATNFTEIASYDALNRPISMSWSPAAAQTLPAAAGVAFSFAYDGSNRRISQSASDATWLAYPGPASTTAYTANALNQYSKIGSTAPTYDANGNLTFDGTFTYAYDAENRLTSIKQGASAIASYAYDARGRRKTKTVGTTTTVYVTDTDDREVLEYDGANGQVQRWYAYGLGPDEVLNQMNAAAGTRATFIPDVQGSIIGTLDSGSGALTRTGYLPYGESGNAAGTFRYTGRRLDPETAGSAAEPSGLYYYRTRMYSPALRRFLQTDPIGYAAGTNLYAYVQNDPLNLTDPTGLAGIGLLAGVTAEAGVPYVSIGATDTAGSGLFVSLNPFSPGFLHSSQGLFTSTGVMATYGNIGNNTTSIPPTPPGKPNGALGAFAGGGAGVFITNSNSLADLSGVSRAFTLKLPVGSMQLSYGGGIVVLAVTAGPGVGASVSTYPTATATQASAPLPSQNPLASYPGPANPPTGPGK